MDKERFKQAGDLYRKGNKKGAEKILMLLSRESDDAEVWYGLARCAEHDEKRIFYLEKSLAAQPDLVDARKELDKLLEKQAGKETARDSSTTAAPDTQDPATSAEKATPFKKREKAPLSPHWIYAPAVLLLLGLMIWQFIRIDHLENSMVLANEDIVTLNGRIRTLTSDLDYAIALAENADNYAHSHYSDVRLKTDIIDIEDPLSKVLQLRGVHYQWNLAEYPDMGFTDRPEIGLIAQDIEQVFPELVTTDRNGYRQVDYDRLTAVLIEAIKEQQKEIDALKGQLK